jgi:DNA-binding CsgD family transcriptional regulator
MTTSIESMDWARVACGSDERDHLSPRERETLHFLMAGDSEKQVARKFGVSRHTVHVYVKRLHTWFGVASRGELLAAAHSYRIRKTHATEGPYDRLTDLLCLITYSGAEVGIICNCRSKTVPQGPQDCALTNAVNALLRAANELRDVATTLPSQSARHTTHPPVRRQQLQETRRACGQAISICRSEGSLADRADTGSLLRRNGRELR